MSQAHRAGCATLMVVLAASGSLAAQQSPKMASADSVMKLNHAGLWSQAGPLAYNAVRGNITVDEKCAYRIGGVYALVRLGLYSIAANELKTLDNQCAEAAAVRKYAADIRVIRAEVDLPPLPKTGLDFSAIDQFWHVADILVADRAPTEAEWRALLITPGYRLATMVVQSVRSDMEIALRPSRRAEFDSLAKLPGDQAARLTHLAAAYAHRPELATLRDSLTRSLPVRAAVAGAAAFLPPHATDGVDPPLVAFALFRGDAYSLGAPGVIVDLYHVLSDPLTPLLAHEFHHSYLSMLTKVERPASDAADAALVDALIGLRNEGIADLVDKPHPLTASSPGLVPYVTRYNEAYARTPAVLRSIDSLLVIAAEDSTQMRTVGEHVAALLPSNGHYNGSYVAREIYQTFGVDSLYPGVANPFALLRTYAAAEAKRGNLPPFSPKAVMLLDALEAKYLRP